MGITNTEVLDYLRSLGACKDAVKWVETHGGTADELWRDCPRGDWMMWVLGHAGLLGSPQHLAACLSDILGLAAGALQQSDAVRDTLRGYADGVVTIDDVVAAGQTAKIAGLEIYWEAGQAAGTGRINDDKQAAGAAGAAGVAAGMAADAVDAIYRLTSRVSSTIDPDVASRAVHWVSRATPSGASNRVDFLRRAAVIIREHYQV